ncbi:MAG: HAMP domain-containing histidine kinase [Nocardioides sp.]|nr:HAMP domain-containing histidine kinase [Nocardioides sp.]
MVEPTSIPPVKRARGDGWGGDVARAAIRQIAEDVRIRTHFGTCEVEVLRPDNMLEFVAITGNDDADTQMLGRASPFAAMEPSLSLGAEYGDWTFVAQEWLTREARQLLTEDCWIPEIPDTDDPDQWRALDILVARIVDDRGRLRALMYLDEPMSCVRPDPTRLRALAQDTRLSLRAVLTALEREELGQQVRLSKTARDVVRAASSRGGYVDLLSSAHDHLVAGFRAQDVTVRVFADPRPEWPELSAAHVPPSLADAVEAAASRAWAAQRVIIVEPGRVWGDELLEQHDRDDLTRHLARHGVRDVVVAPIGAGSEPLGMLVIVRELGGARWTESESSAALDIGHDLGRAILNTRAHEREVGLIAELRRLGHYRAELLSTVSHELQNPLSVILGHVEMLELLPDLPEPAMISVRALGRSASRLTAVVDDLLLLSRMGNMDHPLPRRRVDLAAVLQEVTENEPAGASTPDVTLRTVRHDDALIVSGDPELLFRLCANLVSNAVKYSRPGGVVDLTLARINGQVVLTCTDEGLGISEADQVQLFTEFFRSTNPEALGRPGTGLGLAIVARIVARHDGRIEVESELGVGTTVRVLLSAAG